MASGQVWYGTLMILAVLLREVDRYPLQFGLGALVLSDDDAILKQSIATHERGTT